VADIEFGGDTFRRADAVGLMALMRFAHVAKAGTDSNDLDGLAAMYELLEQCVHEDDWQRFQKTAMKVKAKGDDLMAVVKAVISGEADRPTSRPSDSSDGPIVIGQKSESEPPRPAYLRVVEREEQSGRPDRALMVLMAQEQMASAG
jgi:hypothetical protein